MTDRELLELSAKAAGHKLNFVTLDGSELPIAEDLGCSWNPLVDDGTALRLAVKLGLFFAPELSHYLSLERFFHQDREDCYAHRRAIVRTAAEIGKGLLPFPTVEEIKQLAGEDQ